MMIVLSILIFLIILWSFLMIKGYLKKIDSCIYDKMVFKDFRTVVFKVITSLASTRFFVIVSILLLLMFRNKFAVIIVVFLSVNGIINEILKRIFRRERPNIKRLVKEKGYSYPSGHTMSATCFYGFLIFLIYGSGMYLYLKITIILGLIIFIAFVAFSRIYLGVHYFSDVVAGVLVGIFYTFLYVQLVSSLVTIF